MLPLTTTFHQLKSNHYYLMPSSEKNYYPPVGFYFTIKIEGQNEEQVASFQEVSGLQTELSTEQVTEGGENRFKYRLPTAAKYNNLVMKRGLVTQGGALFSWVNSIINGSLTNPIETKTIMVSLLDSDEKTLMGWRFNNAYPVKWEVANLNSMDNNIAVESMELAYSYFEAINISNK